MTETVTASAPVATTVKKSPAKKKAPGAKAKGVTAAHPATSVMVVAAIKELNEKKGSSLPAIKKYLAANYKVDPVKLAPFIRKFLKAAVVNKTIVQTKGTGASGHFKLATAEAKPKKAVAPKKKLAAKKVKTPGSPKKKKAVVKKAATKSGSGEPAAKKIKKAAAPKSKASKPKKTPKKPAVAPKAKKIAAKKPPTTPKKK